MQTHSAPPLPEKTKSSMRAENESSAAALPGYLMDVLAVCREGGGLTERFRSRGFPGSPVVKTSSSTAGGKSLIPGHGAKIPHASWPKHQIIKNRSNTVTSTIKTLKMVQVKKIYISLKRKREKETPLLMTKEDLRHLQTGHLSSQTRHLAAAAPVSREGWGELRQRARKGPS